MFVTVLINVVTLVAERWDWDFNTEINLVIAGPIGATNFAKFDWTSWLP